MTLLAVASGTERCRAQKTKPGEPQDRSRLVRAGDAPAALPALPAPAGLPLIDVDILFTAELDLAPLLPISSWRSVSTSCSAYRISAVSKASGTRLRPCERPHGVIAIGLDGDWLDRFGALLGDEVRWSERGQARSAWRPNRCCGKSLKV